MASSNVDVKATLAFHREHRLACDRHGGAPCTPVRRDTVEGDRVPRSRKSRRTKAAWINGGFFILRRVLDLIEGDETSGSGADGVAFPPTANCARIIHDGFWHPMDTIRDKLFLEELLDPGKAPWKLW